MPSRIELPAPLKGLNTNFRLSEQPPETSVDLLNVRSVDRTSGRIRLSMRPGLSPYFTGYLGSQGNKVQALGSIAYQARHINYAGATTPTELWAGTLASGASVSAMARGLFDDVWFIDNNKTVRRYNRYGVPLGSVDIPNVDPQHVVGTIEVADDGSVFIATSDYLASQNLSATAIWRVNVGDDGLTLSITTVVSAPGSTGRMVVRLRAHGQLVYSLESNTGAAQSDTAVQVELVSYTNLFPGQTGISRNSVITGASQYINYKTFKDFDATTFPLATSNAAATLYGHDMAIRTTGSIEWIVACGQKRDAATAGSWGMLKVKSDGTMSSSYCITNDEATAATGGPPIRGGGIGFACAVDVVGSVVSMGRRIGGGSADDVWLRKLIDTGTAWTTSGGWTRTEAVDLGGAGNNPQYAFPRIDVDEFGNMFVPTCRSTAGVKAMLALNPAGTIVSSVQIQYPVAGVPTATNNETRTATFAITHPDFLPDDTPKIADTVFIAGTPVTTGTLLSGTGLPSILGYDIMTETAVASPSRAVRRLGVASGSLYTFSPSGPATPTNSTARTPPFSASSRLVQMANMFGETFITDGDNYGVYRPSPNDSSNPNGLLVDWNASGLGVIPPHARLLCRWRNRIVLAHTADSPYAWHMSAFGDAYNWDLFPQEPLETQAVSGSALDAAGNQPQVIHALVPWSDALLFVGCERSILRFDGDPMAGGRLSTVSDETGMAFGTPWCKDPEGRVYFFGSRGGVYQMDPSGQIIWMTKNTIENQLQDIDLSTYTPALLWNARDNGLHVFFLPYAAGGTHIRHYFWSQQTDGWFPDEYGTASNTVVQPTAAFVIDGDTSDDRVLIIGTEDGRVLQWDEVASTDGGMPIDSRAVLGPFPGPDADKETRFSRPSVMLAPELGGAYVKFLASDTPVLPALAASEFRVSAGRNERLPVWARGGWLWAQIRSATRVSAGTAKRGERWALEVLQVDVAAGGRKRVRTG